MEIEAIESLEGLSRYMLNCWPEFLYFWGHVAGNGDVGKHVLSQWWPAPFVVDSVEYATAEHFLMAQKARLFGDDEAFRNIVSSESPSEAERLGRTVRGFDEARWALHRFEISYLGNLAKFSQHNALRKWLLQTDDAVLVEASPVDTIWGVGLASDHVDIHVPDLWRGLNLLGFALMKVRSTLRREDEAVSEIVAILSDAYGRVKRLQCINIEVADRVLAASVNLTDPPRVFLSYRSDLVTVMHRLIDAYAGEAPFMRGPVEEATAIEYARRLKYLLDSIVERKCDPS